MPFELGRPLGVPNDPEFQTRVIRAALDLANRHEGPVLEDFPDDVPETDLEAAEGWSCMLPQPPAPEAASQGEALTWRLEHELALLRPWHEEAIRQGKRSTVGPSGLSPVDIEQGAAVLAYASLGESPNPFATASADLPYLLRLVADDLKAFYFEAAMQQPASTAPSSTDLGRWLYHETVLGTVLYDLRDRLLASDDPREQAVGRQLVPGRWAERQ